mmetsp:Transcript_30292/g.68816  ORF Transcript_30292/g.68816 Transcript_30292/m.68816 type:complete len:224 (-) Transcript_30292:577-1248(-)
MHFAAAVQPDAVGMQLVPLLDDLSGHVRVLARLCPNPRADAEAQWLRHAGHDPVSQLLPARLHPTANEDDATLPRSPSPGPRKVLVPKHVDALQDEHALIPLDVEHALDSQEIRRARLLADKRLQEGLKLEHVDGARKPDADIGDGAVHLGLVEAVELLLVHVLLLQHPRKVECLHSKELIERGTSLLASDDFENPVHLLEPLLALDYPRLVHQVGLVQQRGA